MNRERRDDKDGGTQRGATAPTASSAWAHPAAPAVDPAGYAARCDARVDRFLGEPLPMTPSEREAKEARAVSAGGAASGAGAGAAYERVGGEAPRDDMRLPAGLRGDLEAAVGDDLGDVRIHAGAKGAQTAAGHAARAVAIGQDVYVGQGQWSPETAGGRELIGHEVAHTQQAKLSGQAAPALKALDTPSSDAPAEQEADSFARAFSHDAAMTRWRPRVGISGAHAKRDDDGVAQPAKPAPAAAPEVTEDSATSTPGGPLIQAPGERYSVFQATGKPYIIEPRGGRPGAWVVRDWVVVNGKLRGDSWFAPECAREVLAATGAYESSRLDFAASKLLFRMRRAVDYLSIDADATDATGLAHGQTAVVDRADGGGLHVTIGLDDPTIAPRTEHPLTAQEKIRALDAVVAYTGLVPLAGGVMKAVSRTDETPSITGNGTVFLDLDRQFCRDLFGSSYDRWWRSRSRAAANQSSPKLALRNYYQRPIPGEITHYADIVESGERVRFEVVVDWPTDPVPPDPEVYDAPPMVTPSKVSNVALLKCKWRFERVETAAPAPATADVDHPSSVHTFVAEKLRLGESAPAEGSPDGAAAGAATASARDAASSTPAATHAPVDTVASALGNVDAVTPSTPPSASAKASPGSEQVTDMAEVFHAFRLDPGEQEGTWRVFCDASFDEYFTPTTIPSFDVRVVSAQRAIGELKQAAFTGLGTGPRPQAGRWRTDLDKEFTATPAAGPEGSFFSSPENNDAHADERKLKREQLKAVRDYLDDDATAERNAETLKAIDRELDRQWDTEAALASDRLSGAQPFEVRGTYLSRTEGLASGPLQLHGTVRVEQKSRRQGDTVDIDDVYVVQIRDLSRHFEQEDFTFKGQGPTFAAALEAAFNKLAVAYPKGLVAIEAEELRGDALSRSDGSAGDGRALGTGKALGFQRTTETTWKKVKETVWEPVASTVTNLAAIAIMTIAPEAAPIIIPGLIAYNAIPVIDNVLTQQERGTLTNKELALSVGEIALNLLPVIGSAARFAGAWFVIEGANWGGQVLLLNERAKQRAHQLQNQQVAALAEHYAALVELKKHSTADHAALDRAEAQVEDEVRKVNSAIADSFNAMAGEGLLYAAAGTLIHRVLSRVPGGPQALTDFLDRRGVASVSNGDEGGGGGGGGGDGGAPPTRESRPPEGDVRGPGAQVEESGDSVVENHEGRGQAVAHERSGNAGARATEDGERVVPQAAAPESGGTVEGNDDNAPANAPGDVADQTRGSRAPLSRLPVRRVPVRHESLSASDRVVAIVTSNRGSLRRSLRALNELGLNQEEMLAGLEAALRASGRDTGGTLRASDGTAVLLSRAPGPGRPVNLVSPEGVASFGEAEILIDLDSSPPTFRARGIVGDDGRKIADVDTSPVYGRSADPAAAGAAPYATRLAELARDPDHGNVPTEATRREAVVALALEAQGRVPGPVRRPKPGDGHSGDVVDGAENDWDVKAPKSRATIIDQAKANAKAKGRPEPKLDPNRAVAGEFDVVKFMSQVNKELAAGEGVIIDAEGLAPHDLEVLKVELAHAGVSDKVIVYE